ncbi:MAG: T9SS type A sorting domain-containing protein [Ignavibacteriae bacterium]|nr:T9SS type A sorting domain-containing protein [Ignavibacteriota bacterium]
MTKNKIQYWIYILILFLINGELTAHSSNLLSDADTNKIAGFRASRILSSYPNNTFPEPEYWEQVGDQMSAKFDGYKPGGVWIVSIYLSDPLGYTLLNFPNPTGAEYDSIIFRSIDQNENYLNHFDTTGVKVWLQVEPGGADIDTLISLVLNRYKHHSCVQGFGVDVEWYETYNYTGGKKVNDTEVQRWEENVKAVDSGYTLFLKHYSQSWMPPNYRGEIIFIDDSQDFNWYSNPFNGMITEFKSWGNQFSPNPVGFQIGYPNDQNWWGLFDDPAKTIGDELIANIPNIAGIYWVDFTVISTFPPTAVELENIPPNDFYLSQNFPNPFNPATKIQFTIPKNVETFGKTSQVNLTIFDLLGNEIAELVNEYKQPGTHEVEFDASGGSREISSGIYFYQLKIGNKKLSKKMILLK